MAFGLIVRPKDWTRWLTKAFQPPRADEPRFRERLRKHLTGTRCLVLDYAAHSHHAGQSPDFAPLNQLPLPDLGTSNQALRARIELLRVACDSSKSDAERRAAVVDVIDVTTRLWNVTLVPAVKSLVKERVSAESHHLTGQRHEPSFLAALPNARWQETFRSLAASHSWMDPGLLLAGETLAALFGDARRVEAVATTSILTAAKVAGRDLGIVVPLRLERVAGGCGVLAPDPWSTAYLRMDREFSAALQQAWYAAMSQFATTCDFDWRWALDLRAATRKLVEPPVTYDLGGRSGEVAVACALHAVDGSDPAQPPEGAALDVHVATTAKFKHPFDPNFDLAPVTDVDVKTLGYPFARRRIQTVILACAHDSEDLPPRNHPSNDDTADDLVATEPKFLEVRTFADAYTELSRGPRITREVKAWLHRRAVALREDLCGVEPADAATDGRRYVPSPLAEVLPSQPGDEAATREERLRPLDDAERRAFAAGRWEGLRKSRPDPHSSAEDPLIAPRVRLFADSGLGKTIQLLACEERIAAAGDGRVPVRLGKLIDRTINLSDISWNRSRREVLRAIYEAAVEPGVPDDDSAAGWEWFQGVVARGAGVFLLDALDQSEDILTGLGNFFQLPGLTRSPLLVAGRPETANSRGAVWRGTEAWATLRVLPFDRREQTIFLGTTLAPVLVPKSDDKPNPWDDDYQAELQRHRWKELLGVPLLLKFLGDLAATRDAAGQAKLLTYPHRYAIYQAAVEALLEKGRASFSDGTKGNAAAAMAHRVLPILALESVRRHAFSGVVAGPAYDAARRKLQADEGPLDRDLRYDLVQLNAVTAESLLEGTTNRMPGLEFRHRSMLEYHAGCRLADLFSEESTRAEANSILEDIHNVLEADGVTFRRALLDPGGETCRHLPREWEWTLRFALSHAPEGAGRDALAWRLINLGNPWVVYEGLDQDHLTIADDVAAVCRWLVHRDSARRNYRGAWSDGAPAPVAAWVGACGRDASSADASPTVDEVARGLTEGLLARRHRDAAYLSPLGDLLTATGRAAGVPPAFGEGCRRAWEVYLDEAAGLGLPVIQEVLARMGFVEIPAGEFAPRPDHDAATLRQDGITGPVQIPEGLWFAVFPTTNAQLEGWCPTQRRWREQYSHEDDQPAVWVTAFMAEAWCGWLNGSVTAGAFSLPTEWEWEYACRAGSSTKYWWGDKIDDRLCWSAGTAGVRGTRALQATRDAEQSARRSHPWGLHDMHGNVWEWTASPYDQPGHAVGVGRVVRGGSWDFLAGFVRSALRFHTDPDGRNHGVGLRLSWRVVAVRPESSS